MNSKDKSGAHQTSPDRANEDAVSTPKTTEKPSDTGAGSWTNKVATDHISRSITHDGMSGHGQGEPVPEQSAIEEPSPNSCAASKSEADQPSDPSMIPENEKEIGSDPSAASRSRPKRNHEAAASQPPGDPNASDPNAQTDKTTEIARPGSHGGAGAPGRKPR